MSIDLDAARAQRREAQGTKPSVTFGGRDFVLPVELPMETSDWGRRLTEAEQARDEARRRVAHAEALRKTTKASTSERREAQKSVDAATEAASERQLAVNDVVRGMIRFLLDDQADDFFALRPSHQDCYGLIAGIPAEYGATLGESRASRRSSKVTPASSRQTSKLATA